MIIKNLKISLIKFEKHFFLYFYGKFFLLRKTIGIIDDYDNIY